MGGAPSATTVKVIAAALGVASIFLLVLADKVKAEEYVALVVSGLAALGGHAAKGNGNGS